MNRNIPGWIGVLAVLSIIGLLVLLFFPHRGGYEKARRANCSSNLRGIGLSFKMYAQLHGGRLPMDGDPPTLAGSMRLLSNVTTSASILHCPADRRHRPAQTFDLFTEDNISYCYVAGLNWDTGKPVVVMFDWVESTQPGARWLTNSNHQGFGNVLFTDGQVRGTRTFPGSPPGRFVLYPR